MESPLKHNTKSLEDRSKPAHSIEFVEDLERHIKQLTQQVEELTRENERLNRLIIPETNRELKIKSLESELEELKKERETTKTGQQEFTLIEVFKWFQQQKFQREQGEQEYTMIYEIDLPEIINAFIYDKVIKQPQFCNCPPDLKHGSTTAWHCNHCGKLEQSETWLKEV